MKEDPQEIVARHVTNMIVRLVATPSDNAADSIIAMPRVHLEMLAIGMIGALQASLEVLAELAGKSVEVLLAEILDGAVAKWPG